MNGHGPHGTARENPEHRHHGPHRCRQDDDDRADPLLHRRQLQDRRGPRRRRDDGLDGAGAGARHHDHVGRDDLRTGRITASTSSTPRATSTSRSRSSARCACSTERSACSAAWAASSRSRRRSGARPTSTACRASRSSTRWTASARTSTAWSRMIRERLGANAVPIQIPIGAEDAFAGVVDLLEQKAIVWDDESLGASFEVKEMPEELGRRPPQARESAGRGRGGAATRRSRRSSSTASRSRADQLRKAIREATLRLQDRAGALRRGLQEQGRAAAARRGRRLPAVAARRPAGRGPATRHDRSARACARPTTTSPSPRSPSRS